MSAPIRSRIRRTGGLVFFGAFANATGLGWSITLSFIFRSLRPDRRLSHWWSRVYGERGYYLFIWMFLVRDANEPPEVLDG